MRKKVKKAISLTLAFLVCLLSIPLNFVQATEMQELYVNGVDILQEEAEMPQGVTYDESTSTLTLDNANLDVASEHGNNTNVILAQGNLNIKLVGTNTITNDNSNEKNHIGIEVRGNLTIESDAAATLSVNAQQYRSFHIEGNLTIGNGTNATTVNTNGEVHIEQRDGNGGNITVNANATLENTNGGVVAQSINGEGIYPNLSQPGPNGPGGPGEPIKLWIGSELLLDEVYNAQTGNIDGITIEEGFMPGMTIINVDTSIVSVIDYIKVEGDGFIIFAPDGNITVGANNDGYSVDCPNSDFFIGSGLEDVLVSFKGGIKAGGMVALGDKKVNIGTENEKSPKGIECRDLEVTHNMVQVFTSDVALKNIENVTITGNSSFIIVTDVNATDNVESILVAEGGKIYITYKGSLGGFTPLAGVWPFAQMGTTDEADDGFVPMPDITEATVGTNADYKYVMTDDTGVTSYFSLESTAKAMYNISSNIDGSEDSVVKNGRARVIAGNGYTQTHGGYTDYIVEEGTQVTIELLPDYGYQYASGGLNGVPTAPDEGKATYKFIMPDNNLHLSAIFEKSEDIIKVNSQDIKDASITVAGNDIKGNAKLTIDDKTASSAETQKINSVLNGMTVGSVLDLKLSEEIAKNGSKTDTWSTNITELNEDVNIKIKLDEDLSGFESYKIVRIHNGVSEVLDATYNSSTGELSFNTDRFSTYAVLHSGNKTISKSVTYDNTNITVDIAADDGVIPQGAEISVQVISASTQSKEYSLIKNAVSKIGANFLPLDITLTDSNGNEIQPNGKLKITIKVPDGYKNPVVCYVNSSGEVVKLATTVKDGYCTFEIDHLSYYVLVDQQTISADNSVNTGDASPVVSMAFMAVISFVLIISLRCYKKKLEEKEQR